MRSMALLCSHVDVSPSDDRSSGLQQGDRFCEICKNKVIDRDRVLDFHILPTLCSHHPPPRHLSSLHQTTLYSVASALSQIRSDS